MSNLINWASSWQFAQNCFRDLMCFLLSPMKLSRTFWKISIKPKLLLKKEMCSQFGQNFWPQPQTTPVYPVWKFFKTTIYETCEFQSFKGIALLVPGNRGHITCSGISYSCNKVAFTAMAQSKLKKYTKYLSKLIDSLNTCFEPWPKWMLICNDVFNFSHDLTIA